MNLLYNLAMEAYDKAIGIAAKRNPKAAGIKEGRLKSLDILRARLRPADKPIWFHAASLGEFEQARPIIEEIKRRNPGEKIVVTFFSPSGYEVRKNYPLADAVCYLPADTPGRMHEFIDAINPKMVFFVKYEFWRNALEYLDRRGVATYLVSAIFRPDQLFFKPWGGFYRKWLRWFTHIFVQDEGSVQLLKGIGVSNVTVAGDTRFDRVAAIRESRKKIPEAEAFCRGWGERGGMVMVAGSSWEADEEIYGRWIRNHPEVKLIVAPHEFDATRIQAMKELFGEERSVAMSELREGENDSRLKAAQVLIVDCFGLLSSLYAYADVAYVGGGFGVSIHNINEAAVYGVPVVFGPNNRKFLEAQELKRNGGGLEVGSQSEFEREADRLLADPDYRSRSGSAAGEYIKSKLGATEKILSQLSLK